MRASAPLRAVTAGLAALLAGPAAAQQAALPLPAESRAVVESVEAPSSVMLPVARWEAGAAETVRAEGTVRRRVWQVPVAGLTTEALMRPIRSALEAAGYTIVLSCEAAECGGFEFRFATDTLPPPEMYVDLGAYRYLAARLDGQAGPHWRAVMVSATAERGFVQVTSVDPGATLPARAAPTTRAGQASQTSQTEAPPDAPGPDAPGPDALGRALAEDGRAVLWDLAFETGATALGVGSFASLDGLAAWLRARPEARVALVGHTDTEGGLGPNIDLSRQRAAAVRDRLVEGYGIAPERLSAEGVGYLAPVASNATEAGRERNRRVEVVLVSGG